jgi:hypothetical protein
MSTHLKREEGSNGKTKLSINSKRKHHWTLGGKKPNCLFLDPRYIGKQLSNSRGEIHWKNYTNVHPFKRNGRKEGLEEKKKIVHPL